MSLDQHKWCHAVSCLNLSVVQSKELILVGLILAKMHGSFELAVLRLEFGVKFFVEFV